MTNELPTGFASGFSFITGLICLYIVIVLVKHSEKKFYHLWNKLAAILFFCTMAISFFRFGLLVRDVVTDHAPISDTMCYVSFGFNEFFSAAVEVFYVIFLLTLSVPRFYEPASRRGIEWALVPCVTIAFGWACLATAIPLFTNVPLKHRRAWCWLDESNSPDRFAFVYVASSISVLVSGGFILWVVDRDVRVPKWRVLTFAVTQFLVVGIYAIFTFVNAASQIPEDSPAFKILGIWLTIHDTIRAIAFIIAEKLYPPREFFTEGYCTFIGNTLCCRCLCDNNGRSNHQPGKKRSSPRHPNDTNNYTSSANDTNQTLHTTQQQAAAATSGVVVGSSLELTPSETEVQRQIIANNANIMNGNTTNTNNNNNNLDEAAILLPSNNNANAASYSRSGPASEANFEFETAELDTLTYFVRVLQRHSIAGVSTGMPGGFFGDPSEDGASQVGGNRPNPRNRRRKRRGQRNNDNNGDEDDDEDNNNNNQNNDNDDDSEYSAGFESSENDSVYAGGRGASFMKRYGSNADSDYQAPVHHHHQQHRDQQFLSQYGTNNSAVVRGSPLQNSQG